MKSFLDDSAKIDGARLKPVLEEALPLFCDAGRQYIMDDFAAYVVRFEKDRNYSLG